MLQIHKTGGFRVHSAFPHYLWQGFPHSLWQGFPHLWDLPSHSHMYSISPAFAFFVPSKADRGRKVPKSPRGLPSPSRRGRKGGGVDLWSVHSSFISTCNKQSINHEEIGCRTTTDRHIIGRRASTDRHIIGCRTSTDRHTIGCRTSTDRHIIGCRASTDRHTYT